MFVHYHGVSVIRVFCSYHIGCEVIQIEFIYAFKKCVMSNRSSVPQPALAWACHRASVRMQAVSDLLLLADDIRPIVSFSTVSYSGHESLAQCRDAVISRTQRLLSDSSRISEHLHAAGVRWAEIALSVSELSELVVSLIESCTQTTYLMCTIQPDCVTAMPGIVDPYAVSLPHLDIELCCQRLKRMLPNDLAPAVLVQTCEEINRCLTLLTSCCSHASQNASDPNSRDQFKLCVKSFTASASCLLSSVKRFKSEPIDIHHRRCVTFSGTLVASTAATVNFATEPSYIGKPANLTNESKEMKKNIFGR